MKKWELAPDVPGHLLQKYSETTRKMLFVRGLTAEQDAEKFLLPKYEDLFDPFLFKDMEKAVVRIFEAIEGKEKIVIYSDYDCDGIPAATIMSDLFKKLNYENVRYYIPDRHDEGYGLNMEAVKEFVNDGTKLLVTFDLGTTTPDETAYATANGIDVIITDHHLPHGQIPRSFAILNPHLENSGYPEQVLSGAGVAFKLACGFVKKYGEYFKIHDGWEKWLLDMASLGTLSDMVPIKGENRILSYFGMKVLRKNMRPGLKALFSKMKMDTEHLTEDDLTFMVAPRINAASRMDSPIKAFELLSSENNAEAIPRAEYLSKINDDRKLLVARIMKEVKSNLNKRSEESPIIVIGNTGWRAGILGLVAGKLTDELKKPVFVWGMEEKDEFIKGSCRSDGSVNVVELMTVSKESFVQFGGHTVAGGFVSTREKIHYLEAVLSENYVSMQNKISDEIKIKGKIDGVAEVNGIQQNEGTENLTENKNVALSTLSLDKVKSSFIDEVNRFAPFGVDNPKPIFLFQNVRLDAIKQFGKTKEHLEVMVSDENTSKKAMAFFKTINDFGNIAVGATVTLVGTLEISYFRGKEARVRIVDIF